jgi:hypothetical protein
MSREPAWPWSVLGLPKAPQDPADVRRAYARALKQIDQATDIAGFAALREAYEAAGHRLASKAAKPQTRPGTVPPEVVAALGHEGMEALLDDAALDALLHDEAASQPGPGKSPDPRRDDAIAALFHDLPTASIVAHLGDRIMAALANPLSHDPGVAPRLRAETARLLRAMAYPDCDGGAYLSLGLRPAILALDARFHWLSDFAAFRRDFWQDTLVLDAMIACAGIELTVATPPKPNRPTGKGARAIAFFASQTFWLSFAAVIVGLLFAGGLIRGTPYERAFWVFFAVVFLVPVAVGIGILVFTVIKSLIANFAIWKERRDDRRALRANGVRFVEPSIPLRQRLSKYTRGLWLLLFLFMFQLLRALLSE